MADTLLDWMADGLCLQTDPDIFTPEKGGSAAAAKKVCAECDVRGQCLQYALKNNEHGIWGGLSDRERKNLRTPRLRRSVREHGTNSMYSVGCHNEALCPTDGNGKTCSQAHREYIASVKRRHNDFGGDAT